MGISGGVSGIGRSGDSSPSSAAGSRAEKHAQRVNRLLGLALQGRDLRFGGGDLGLGVGDVKAADEAGADRRG